MATSSFYNTSGSTPTQATDIATSVDQAQDAAQEAEAKLTEFKSLYMGVYSTEPVAKQDGSLYFNDATSLLYYWNGTAWTATNTTAGSTDDIAEGSTNLYFTAERVDDQVNTLLTAGSNVTLTYDDAAGSLTIDATGGSTLTDTDDLTEGATNLYYTDARADARIAAAGHITASSTDTLTNKSGNISQWTNDSNYLTGITGQSLYSLSNVNTSASPSDGQVLAWDNANSYWTPVAASSGGGISLTDISVTQNTAGTAALSYNSTTGVFSYTPPDLSSYATTASLASVATSGAYADITGTPTLATVATSGAYSDLSGTPSLSGYLTGITSESLADLSDVDSTAPTDGQVLTWDNANSYWKPATGGSSIDYAAHGTDADSSGSPTANADNSVALGYGAEATAADTVAIGNKAKATGSGAIRIGLDSNVTGLPASGTGAISIGWGSNGSGYLGLALGYSSNATASTSMAIGANAYATHSKSIALGYGADTSATNQLMLGDAGTTYGFSSIRVGNTSYTPSDNMDLATKKYVDDNAGGGGGANIVTGTFTTTSTTYVDAGELLDTDDGFIGAVEVLLHATRGTGTSMKTTLLPCLFCFNPGNPSVSNWTTFPTIGNAGSGSYEQLGFVSFRFDTSTNKLYLQVKNNAATSTVYNWTAKIV